MWKKNKKMNVLSRCFIVLTMIFLPIISLACQTNLQQHSITTASKLKQQNAKNRSNNFVIDSSKILNFSSSIGSFITEKLGFEEGDLLKQSVKIVNDLKIAFLEYAMNSNKTTFKTNIQAAQNSFVELLDMLLEPDRDYFGKIIGDKVPSSLKPKLIKLMPMLINKLKLITTNIFSAIKNIIAPSHPKDDQANWQLRGDYSTLPIKFKTGLVTKLTNLIQPKVLRSAGSKVIVEKYIEIIKLNRPVDIFGNTPWHFGLQRLKVILDGDDSNIVKVYQNKNKAGEYKLIYELTLNQMINHLKSNLLYNQNWTYGLLFNQFLERMIIQKLLREQPIKFDADTILTSYVGGTSWYQSLGMLVHINKINQDVQNIFDTLKTFLSDFGKMLQEFELEFLAIIGFLLPQKIYYEGVFDWETEGDNEVIRLKPSLFQTLQLPITNKRHYSDGPNRFTGKISNDILDKIAKNILVAERSNYHFNIFEIIRILTG